MGITAYREYFDFNQTGSDPMKIERINENQIRCTLSNFDLSVRNMNLASWPMEPRKPVIFSAR